MCGETGVRQGPDRRRPSTATRRGRAFPFVKVGCTLFPSQLIESELYGHEKGSFTGAEQRRLGRFELAEGGTLYLDDVDDIPLEHQAKLLRAIEEKVFERVGGTTPIRANVRIVASTKRDLLEKIAAGTFRQDLYYRLDVLRVNIPPLRERREDIPLLAEHLLKRIAKDDAVATGTGGRRGAPAARLAGQRPRVAPRAPARLPGRLAARSPATCCLAELRRAGRRSGRSRRPVPGNDRQDRAGIAGTAPCRPPAATSRPPPPRWE